MKIIAGTTHENLARNIASHLRAEFIKAEVRRFNDGELAVTIPSDLACSDAVIVQSTCAPVNDNLFELLLLIDTVKRAKAKDIIIVIPYFGYGRNDHVATPNSSVGARLATGLLEKAGATKIITIDLHSKKALEFFKIPIVNLSAGDLFLPMIKATRASVIVSPDHGGVSRAQQISESLSLPLAIMAKERNHEGVRNMSIFKGDVQGKHCIIIDDIIDSGGTLLQAAQVLTQYGAVGMEAFITHGVFSNHAEKKFENSPFENIYITDSIVGNKISNKFMQVSIDNLVIAKLKELF